MTLRDDSGHCITLSRTYMALCRLLGIPAREVTGGLAVAPQGPDRYGISTYDNPIFGHTWVELYAHETGWLPVEFHGIALGRHAMTADNVTDPLLRQRIEQHSEAFLDYYFGHIDCHRVMCSKSVVDIPQLMVPNPNAATEPNRPLTVPEGLHYECHLTLEIIHHAPPRAESPEMVSTLGNHPSPLGGESPPTAAVGGIPRRTTP